MATARALQAARGLLRAMAAARQVHGLYPEHHPDRRGALADVLAYVHDLQGSGEPEPVLFVTRHSFYLGEVLLARESLSLFRLVEAFERAGIVSMEFAPGVQLDDLSGLVEILSGDRPLTERIGGVVLNRTTPAEIDVPLERLDLTGLRRSYASGLAFLRETAARVASGEAADLQAATATVEGLAEQVVQDPAHALLLTTVKSYDEYTYYHMLNVSLLSIALGQAIGLHPDQVTSLGLGALLHDVGKVNMPEDVLFHVGRLSEEQWRIVQRHPVEGAGMVFRTGEGLFHPAASVVLEHHAAYDLSGYPDLSGRDRPSLPARLVAVADCFDAVTSKRAYRAAAGRRQALEILTSAAGKGFDPGLVRIFTSLLGLFPVGSVVELDSGEVAMVIGNDPGGTARPTVLVVLDAAGNAIEPEERDLSATVGDGYRWSIIRPVSAEQLGIDVMGYLTGGDLAADDGEPGPGLVHEPSFGERSPDGYVDVHHEVGGGHGHRHGARELGVVDPDVAPPFEDGRD